ncbi:unnamed protein product [Onchocerca flexuosa]|uniref:Uncharacterized protein n=1 Tax=Onchocerca flexuosa TaxID=387005 RepID=A0A183HMK5_9BILA|nr:unnamed protein product [Onchocerca flexuosa]
MPIFCMIPNIIRLKAPGLIVLPFIVISFLSSTTIYLILLACTTTASSLSSLSLMQSSTILLPISIIFVFLLVLFAVNRNHEDELNSIKERYEKQVCDNLFSFPDNFSF